MAWLQNLNFTRLALWNFIVLSLWGLALRYMHLAALPVNYQYILHAHSHFAFSGWMFLAIAFLLARLCCGDRINAKFGAVLILAQLSAWGMLFSFSLQGYQPISIVFSTLFVAAGFRLAYLVWRCAALRLRVNGIAWLFIRGAMLMLCLSAVGPSLLGPLAALGLKGSPFYSDAIYFYLHFQLNGFMELAVLGLLAATLPLDDHQRCDRNWCRLFIYSALPLFFIFTLWARPGPWLRALASIGTGLNLLSWLVILVRFWDMGKRLPWLQKSALFALTVKCLLQVAICIPLIGEWTFANRDLIIGYIHLLTLGILLPLLIGQFADLKLLRCGLVFTWLMLFYAIVVILYLGLLFLQPMLALWAITVPHYQTLLCGLCAAFLLFGLVLLPFTHTNN